MLLSKKLSCFPRAASALTLLAAASVASAQTDATATTGSVALNLGAAAHYQRLSLAYQTPAFWRSGNIDAIVELNLAYWRTHGARQPRDMWQFGATPFLRWSPGEHLFVELGLGVNAFSRTRFAQRTLSTAFQFGEHLGLGWRFVGGSVAGLRVSHYSNASIKRPNTGLNLVQVYYSQPF